jgi:hypothetical protein
LVSKRAVSEIGEQILYGSPRLGRELAFDLLLREPGVVQCVGELGLDPAGHDVGFVEERVWLWGGMRSDSLFRTENRASTHVGRGRLCRGWLLNADGDLADYPCVDTGSNLCEEIALCSLRG